MEVYFPCCLSKATLSQQCSPAFSTAHSGPVSRCSQQQLSPELRRHFCCLLLPCYGHTRADFTDPNVRVCMPRHGKNPDYGSHPAAPWVVASWADIHPRNAPGPARVLPFGSTQTIQSLSSRLETPVLALYSPAWAGLYGATSRILEGTYYLIQAGCVALLPPPLG